MVQNSELANNVAVVTGGAQGIGKRIVQTLANAGATVIVADIVDAPSTQTGENGTIIYRLTDISQPSQVEKLVQFAVEAYGRLDIWVNNAKANIDAKMALTDMPLETWTTMLDVSLTGAFLGAKYALPVMVTNQHGVIINLSSPHAFYAYPHEVAYDVAKAGLLALTRSIAADYGQYNIRCNTLVPGATADPDERGVLPEWAQGLSTFYPLNRVATTADIAEAVLFLVSDAAQFINGATLTVDGGMSARSPEYAAHL